MAKGISFIHLPLHLVFWCAAIPYQVQALTKAYCTRVDMSAQFPSHADIGDTATCYAFAAARLMSHSLGIKPPDTLSAMDVLSRYILLNPDAFNTAQAGITFKKGSNTPGALYSTPRSADRPATKMGIAFPWRVNGGFADVAAAAVIRSGHICLESEIPSQSLQQETIVINRRMEEARRFIYKSPSNLIYSQQLRDWVSPERPSFIRDQCSSYNSPLMESGDFATELTQRLYDWSAVKLRSDIDRKCLHPVSTSGLKVETHVFSGDPESLKRSLNTMDNFLSAAPPKPFGLTIRTCAYEDCDHSGVHTNVVIGRKWDEASQSCLLQISELGGGNCPKMKPGLICEKGTLWLPDTLVAGQPHEITAVLKDP